MAARKGGDDGRKRLVPRLEPLEERLAPATTLSIAASSAIEPGPGGTVDMDFTVTRTGDLTSQLTVGYTTVAGTAQAGTDFTPETGTTTFASGSDTATIAIPIFGNGVFNNPSLTFSVQLTGIVSEVGPPVTLAARTDFHTETSPFSVAVADINGDGKPDLITANFYSPPGTSSTVSVLLNTTAPGATTPSFATQQTFAVGVQPFSVAAGDINGDGRPDLVIANSYDNTVSVLLNTTAPGATTASFATQQTFATGNTPLSVTLADLNGDRRPDLIVANENDNTVSVLLNTTAPGATTASFATQQTFATGSGPSSVAARDVNGDGRPDLVVANSISFTVSVLLNTTAPGATTASFATQQTFATGPSPSSVALGDVNGDGRPDVMVANVGLASNTVSVLLNTTAPGATTASFATQQTFATGNAPFAVALADLNGDGRPDLVVPNEAANTLSVLVNTTAAGATTLSFAPQETFPTGVDVRSVALADVNGDGKPDVILPALGGSVGNSTVSVLLNTTVLGDAAITPDFPQTTAAVGSRPVAVVQADLNGDGKPDLVVLNFNAGTMSVLRNTTAPGATTPTFATQQTFALGSDLIAIAVGDINGDGKPDLAIADAFYNRVDVLVNTTPAGATTFSFNEASFTTGQNPRGVALADLNGDGKPDLIVTNAYSTTVSVLLNTTTPGATTASFAAHVDFPLGITTGIGFPQGVAVADVNGDGKPDLVIANSGYGNVSVLLNTMAAGATTPSFATKVDFSTGSNDTFVAVGDVNGDGLPDLVTSNAHDGTVSVLLNTTTPGAATPSFATQRTFAVGNRPYSLALADLNGDGKPDIAVVNYTAGTVSVLLDQTAPGATVPSFATQQTFAVGTGPYGLTAGDLNGDGRPDLVAANQGANTVSVLLNTPATISTATATGTITESDPPPTVQLSTASETVSEDAGTFSVTVTLSSSADATTTVPFTVGGTASAGIDYSNLTPSPLVFTPGQTSATITGTLLDDGAPDAVKTLTITLGTPTNATLGAITTFTLTLSEPLPPPSPPGPSPSPSPPPSPPSSPPPSVSVAFGLNGEVMTVVTSNGLLFQIDAGGFHLLGGGVRSASVAFGPGGEELLVTLQTSQLLLLDATGVHSLGSGVLSASLAFGPFGPVFEVVSLDGTLTQQSASGSQVLANGVSSSSVAFAGGIEVLDVVFADGRLVQWSPLGALTLSDNVLSAAVAFDGNGNELMDVLFSNHLLLQLGSGGIQSLGVVF